MKATRRAKITALGRYVPPKVVTNHDLAKRVDTNHDWIVERTGILERHMVEPGTPTSELAAKAVGDLLQRRGIEADEIEVIIVATVTPDMFFPATACLVQNKVRASRAWGFDVSAACSGFLYALTIGAQFIQSGAHDKVVVIGADVMSSIINFEDRTTCVLFGDGAGAVVLQRTDRPGGLRSFVLGSDGCGAPRLFVPAGGSKLPASQESVEARSHFLQMEGSNVFRFATKVIPGSIVEALEKAGLTSADLGLVIPHQANIRIIDHAREKLNLPAERVFTNVDRYGNTSAASIPVALCEALEEGRIKERDIVAMCAFGAGLCWAAAVWEWN